MDRTHKIVTSFSRVLASMAGFTLTTDCHALMLDNNGKDDAKVYANNDMENFYDLKAGASLVLRCDSNQEQLADALRITFDTTVLPLVSVVKQTKSMID